MSVVIKSTEMSYKDPTTGEYTGINVVAEKKTSEAISEIQAEGATQVAAVGAKGVETLESIPDDYTALSNKVTGIKNGMKYSAASKVRLEDLSISELGTNLYNSGDPNVIRGGYINDNGEYIENSSFFQTGYIPVIPGTKYTSTNVSGFVLWFDASKTYLSTTSSADFYRDKYAIAPENAFYGRFLGLVADEATYGVAIGDFIGIEMPKYVSNIPYDILSIQNGQILSSDLSIIETTKNLFNKYDPNCIMGGYIGQSGTFVENANYNQSGFIPVEPGEKYTSTTTNTFVLWYDSAKNLIGSTGTSVFSLDGYVTAIAGAKYARFVTLTTYWDTFQVEKGETQTSYVPYKASLKNEYLPSSILENIDLSDLKFTCYGDSLAYREKWQSYLVAKFGFTKTNLGIGSTTMAYVAQYEEQLPCMVNANRIAAVEASDPDILTIIGGANDYGRGVSIGTESEFSKTLSNKDKTTFLGAYSYLIETLLTWKPTLNIIIMVVQQFTAGAIPYINATRKVAEYYALPTADLARYSGITLFDHTTYTEDGIHFNDAGGLRVANIVNTEIEKLYRIQ